MKHRLIVGVLFCVAIYSRLSAAVVVWDTPTTVSGPSDILNTGTFFAASSSLGAPATVNGVTFAGRDGSANIAITRFGTYSPGSTHTGDTGYDTLLGTGYFTDNNGTDTITLSGLTIGETYRIQLWSPAWDANYPTTFAAGNTVDMGNSGAVGKTVFGYFVADDTTEVISYYTTPGGMANSPNGIIGPVAIFQIPEPSTYALCGGLLALGVVVRRRQRLVVAA